MNDDGKSSSYSVEITHIHKAVHFFLPVFLIDRAGLGNFIMEFLIFFNDFL